MIANGEIGWSGVAPKVAEGEFKFILDKRLKKSSSEESHVKEIQRTKDNAAMSSAQVYKFPTQEHKSMLSLQLGIISPSN